MQLHEYVASQIVRGTRKQFSRLHADFLEIEMELNGKNEPLKAGLNEDAALEMAQTVLNGRTSSDSINSGMSCTSQVNVGPIRPVDRKTIEGSTPGDFRKQASPAVLPANPAVREQMRGQQNSRFYNEDGAAFQFERLRQR